MDFMWCASLTDRLCTQIASQFALGLTDLISTDHAYLSTPPMASLDDQELWVLISSKAQTQSQQQISSDLYGM